MPRSLIIIFSAILVLTLAAIPPLNNYIIEQSVEQLCLTTQSQGHDYYCTFKEQHKGYLHSSYHLELFQPQTSPIPLTLEVNNLGLGPKTLLSTQEQPLFTSTWQWQPLALQLLGSHQFDPSFNELSHSQWETEISLTHMSNQILLPSLMIKDDEGLLQLTQLSLHSQANYPKDQFMAVDATQWQHQFNLDELHIDLPDITLSIQQMDLFHQFTSAIPLDNFSSKMTVKNMLLTQRGLPIQLNDTQMEIEFHADSRALTELQVLFNNDQLNDWQFLTPLVRPGLKVEIKQLKTQNEFGNLIFNFSLDLPPTQLDGSTLSLLSLLQNITVKIEGSADIALLESILDDEQLVVIEQAVSRGWIKPQANQLTSNLLFKDGQFSLR